MRRFLDPKVSISYATGPMTRMSMSEFRAGGWDWIRRHFAEYATTRLPEEKATAVFKLGHEREFMRNRYAVRIRVEDSGDLTIIPQRLRKSTLAGLESLEKETRRTIPANSPPGVFWRTFDEVLDIAARA